MKLLELILNFIKKPYIWLTLVVIGAVLVGWLTTQEIKAFIMFVANKMDIDVKIDL